MSLACTRSTTRCEKRTLSWVTQGSGVTGCTASLIRNRRCASCRLRSVRFSLGPTSGRVPHYRGGEGGHACPATGLPSPLSLSGLIKAPAATGRL